MSAASNSTTSPRSRCAHPAEMGSHSQKTLLLILPVSDCMPDSSKTNSFWRPSSKLTIAGDCSVGALVTGRGVRLVHVPWLPSHSQTAFDRSVYPTGTE